MRGTWTFVWISLHTKVETQSESYQDSRRTLEQYIHPTKIDEFELLYVVVDHAPSMYKGIVDKRGKLKREGVPWS